VDLAGELRETSLSSKILQTHQQADMGHDALRADVLLAFQTQTPGSVNKIADVRKDLAEHAADFNNAIDTNLKLAKNPEIRTALTEVAAPLADYVAAAQSIVAKVDTQPEAAANDMGPFMEKFLVLEEAMAKVSERIEALSKRDVEHAAHRALFSEILMVIILVIGLSSCVLLMIMARRVLVQPIAEVTRVVDRLAKGDLTVAVPTTTRTDEIGLLTRALHTFKQAIADRASEVEAAEQRRMLEEERRQNEERRLVAERQDAPRMHQQPRPGLGRRHPGLAAREQRLARALLELAHLLADRGLREEDPRRRGREAARVDHRHQRAQLFQIESLHGLSIRYSDGFHHIFPLFR
jgi:methyl-accepting chemotaxis protein